MNSSKLSFSNKRFEYAVVAATHEYEAELERTGTRSVVDENFFMLAVACAGIYESMQERALTANRLWHPYASLCEKGDEGYRESREYMEAVRSCMIYDFVLSEGIMHRFGCMMIGISQMMMRFVPRMVQAEAPSTDWEWVKFLQNFGGWDDFTTNDLDRVIWKEYGKEFSLDPAKRSRAVAKAKEKARAMGSEAYLPRALKTDEQDE